MEEYFFVTPLVPEMEIFDESRLSGWVTEERVRVLEAGFFAIIYSSLKAEEWQWILLNCPEILRVRDEQGREVFRVEIAPEGPGRVLEDLVSFSRKVSSDGYPVASVLLDPDSDIDNAEVLLKIFREPLNRLGEIEQMALVMLPESMRQGRVIRSRIARL